MRRKREEEKKEKRERESRGKRYNIKVQLQKRWERIYRYIEVE